MKAIQNVTYPEALHILRLRVIIARAGQSDALRWWEDDSLTTNGAYLLERIFPGDPFLMGRNLALVTATLRHEAAVEGMANTLHLFRIDAHNGDRLAMRELKLKAYPMDNPSAISTMDALYQTLLDVTQERFSYETTGISTDRGGLRIRLPKSNLSLIERANVLAWAYLEGQAEKPVFPYFVEQA